MENELKKLENNKSSLLNEIKNLNNEKSNLLNDVNRLNIDKESAQNELTNLENEILAPENIYDLTIDRDYYQEKIDELKEIIDNRNDQYDQYLKNYNNGNYDDQDNFIDDPFSNNSRNERRDDKDIILKPILIGSISPIYPQLL